MNWWKFLWRKKNTLTPREAASKRRMMIFIICVIFSALFWLFTKLSKENQADFHRHISFEAVPDDHVGVAQSDSLIQYTLQTIGTRLLHARFLSNRDTLRFPVDDLPFIRRNGKRIYYVTQSQLTDRLTEELEDWANVVDVQPDTVFFEPAPALTKKLPVKLEADISFAQRFDQYGTIELDPDSVVVTGPKCVMDSTTVIRTRFWDAGSLRKTTRKTLPLKPPGDGPSFTLEHHKVSVKVPVEEYTESAITLPITVECSDQQQTADLRLFPNHVNVGFLVALRDYQIVDDKMFLATVPCPQDLPDSESRLTVELQAYPAFVDVLYIRPEKVDYLILD
ncbi:MAG: YbbR-like domain-containing protein [Bacteroidales bacterium]